MSPEFKRMAEREIEDFKAECKLRFPGRDVETLTDEELLREVMNTVGKAGKLGENIKCVVSVSMLTEGWDANTVTHILGVRAFSSQLLCEQVVGRGLRRMSYAVNDEGMFDTEYAEVYGVPFSFIPSSGAGADAKPGPVPTRVRALKERRGCEITFPRVTGYRYDFGSERIEAAFSADSRFVLSTEKVPTRTETAPIVGESSEHTLDDLRQKRPNEIAFSIAKLTLEQYFRDDSGFDRPWLFPQLLKITKAWLRDYVICKDNTFMQMLWLQEHRHDSARLIYNAIAAAPHAQKLLKPVLRPYDTFGSTETVDFDTIRPVFATKEDKCHVSHVVADTDSWEQKMAEALESMDQVRAYVKNHNLGFSIPYTLNGEERSYIPDFLVRYVDDVQSGEELNLIIEVTGEKDRDKAAKVSAATTLWVPAVNNHAALGRWLFLEILDPWNAKTLILEAIGKTKEEIMKVVNDA
jgi:type III restriction enzyme